MQVVENESKQQKNKVHKFKESAWKCIYYLSAEILALAVTHDEPWFKNTKYFWLGPGNQTWHDQRYKLKLKTLYMYAGGFYTCSIFALIFWEMRRSDFRVSTGHRVATCILMVFSYVSSYEVVQTLDEEKHKLAGPIYYYIFNFLVFSLLVLHNYWWILMFQMLVKQVQARGQISEDVRSDSEDEDQHEDWS